MAKIIHDDDEEIDAEKCLDLGGEWDPTRGECVLQSDTDAISDGEKIAVVPTGKDETVVVTANRFADVSDKYGDGKKHYRIW